MGFFGGGSADFVFMGMRIFLIYVADVRFPRKLAQSYFSMAFLNDTRTHFHVTEMRNNYRNKILYVIYFPTSV